MSKENRNVYKLPPCPAYDIEGMESWLTDMAQQGFMLAKDGFFAGIAAFERTKPQNVRYRLDAALKETSMWAEDGGEPDPEALDLTETFGWEYIGIYRKFYIYRTAIPNARELNTDPKVQAFAVKKACKSQAAVAFWVFVCLILVPLIKINGSLFITMINAHTWLFLLGAFLLLWLFMDSLAKFFSLCRLRKKLQNGEVLEHSKDWKNHMMHHRAKKVVQIGLIAAWVFILFHNWSYSASDKDRISLEDYSETPPFATIADFISDDSSCTLMWSDLGFNTMREWSDWLAPANYDWNENAALKRSDGTTLEGGLNVDYHEAVNPWIARRLASEYFQQDKCSQNFKLIDCPELNADYAVAYINNLHFPTVIIQSGNKVIHASFYQIPSSNTITMEEWTAPLADSIR